MTPYPIEVGPTIRLPPLLDKVAHDIARMPMALHFRGEPGLPKWEGRRRVCFDALDPAVPWWDLEIFRRLWLQNRMPRLDGYTGPNVRLGDYYVRELERIGTEHRQVVRFEVVGTGRVETLPRSRFDRQARAA